MKPKSYRERIKQLISRLDVMDPDFHGSPQVKKALGGDARLYIGSWVLPTLRDLLEREERKVKK